MTSTALTNEIKNAETREAAFTEAVQKHGLAYAMQWEAETSLGATYMLGYLRAAERAITAGHVSPRGAFHRMAELVRSDLANDNFASGSDNSFARATGDAYRRAARLMLDFTIPTLRRSLP